MGIHSFFRDVEVRLEVLLDDIDWRKVECVTHNSGLSGDSIQRVLRPAVSDDGEKAPALKFGQPASWRSFWR